MLHRSECQCGEIWENPEERDGGKVVWMDSYGENEGLEVRSGLEEVAKVEDITPALETNVGDEDTERTRTEVATCEGEAA